MHKYRTAARHSAWYEDDPKHPNYNPFRKIKSRTPDADEENRLRAANTRYSETNVTPSIEVRRRTDAQDEIQSPVHANTMPSSSKFGGTAAPRPISEIDEVDQEPNAESKEIQSDRKETSEESMGRTSETVVPEDMNANAHPRKRRVKIMEKLHLKHEKPDGAADDMERRASSSSKKEEHFTVVSQLRATLLNSWINVLFIMVPIGIAANYAKFAPPSGIFVINFIAIIPLAAMLSYATEEIALRVGETLGGLLNATFGNAVELIVSIIALTHNEVDIVQESLVGSILSNLLLVLGMCFFFGGVNRVEQFFNVTVAQTASSLLALAVGSLIIPAAFLAWANGGSDDAQAAEQKHVTALSRGTSILLLLVYGAYLFFQLSTHAEMYNAPSQKVEKRRVKVKTGDVARQMAQAGAGTSATAGQAAQETFEPEVEEKEEPQLSKWVAMATLAISTAFVAFCAEGMVNSINAITASGTVSRTFVGLILLPIVGNAAEHATAVTVACKDKMDLAIGVAVGSSMQIALLVIPFMVVLGWIIGNEEMNLAFDGFQIAVLFVAVLLVNYLIQDGKSHWLEGVLLNTLYMIIAIAAWYYPPPPGTETS